MGDNLAFFYKWLLKLEKFSIGPLPSVFICLLLALILFVSLYQAVSLFHGEVLLCIILLCI